MRKKVSFWTVFFLSLFLFMIPCQAAERPDSGSVIQTFAVKKNGLVKEKGKYRYYRHGRRIKKAWKTIKKKKYYFLSNGDAAVGSVKIKKKYYIFNEKGQLFAPSANKVVKVGKVKYQVNKKGQAVKGWSKNKKYYFYENGRMVTGTEVFKEKFYCFKSSGKYDKTRTSQLRKAAKYEKPFAELLALIGEPKKRKYSRGCYGNGTDCKLTYDNFVVYTSFDEDGVERFMGAE
jgi:hypothetical protein